MFSLKDYDYEFPRDLIAKYPLMERDKARLLVLTSRGEILHLIFHDLPSLLKKGDVLVVNNTKVLKARVRVRRKTGGRGELLLLKEKRGIWEALYRGKFKSGEIVRTEKGKEIEILRVERGKAVVRGNLWDIMETEGEIPIPPYIKRKEEEIDREYYQTVYAKKRGSVAAPTAGLHFTPRLISEIENMGVKILEITLHVSWDTFRPIKEEDIRRHKLQGEMCEVPERVCEEINSAKREGRRVIACGTTVVRALETAGANGLIKPFKGVTELYIRPPYKFRVVDAIITNFHFPRSTLLVLVCTFAGRRRVLHAYREAIKRRYRLFSYGDATFIFKKS